MKHLSGRELCEYLDAASRNPQDPAARHIAECRRCQTQLALHRAIGKHASVVQEDMLPGNFTKRIMRHIQAPQSAPRFSWLIDNSANVFAMFVVVGIVGLSIYVASQSSAEFGDSMYTRQITLWHDAYASIMNSIAAHNRGTILPAISGSTDGFGSVFWTGVAALAVLGFLDKLRTFSRTIKTR